MITLLPCPFCGRPPHRCMNPAEVEIAECRTEECPAAFTPVYADNWNRRAPITVDDAMVERALIAQRDALKIMPGRDSIDYSATMRAALEAAIGGKS